MNHALIAISFLIIATALLLTAYRTLEHRALTVGAGVFTLILGGYAAWLAWPTHPAPAPQEPATREERLITIHGFGEPPSLDQRVASEADPPDHIVAKMGCGVCH